MTTQRCLSSHPPCADTLSMFTTKVCVPCEKAHPNPMRSEQESGGLSVRVKPVKCGGPKCEPKMGPISEPPLLKKHKEGPKSGSKKRSRFWAPNWKQIHSTNSTPKQSGRLMSPATNVQRGPLHIPAVSQGLSHALYLSIGSWAV